MEERLDGKPLEQPIGVRIRGGSHFRINSLASSAPSQNHQSYQKSYQRARKPAGTSVSPGEPTGPSICRRLVSTTSPARYLGANLTEFAERRKTPGMQSQTKRKKLPRGLHWDSRSPYIFFKWRDAMGRQRRHSTQTDDPEKALLAKLQFLQEQRQKPQEIEARTEDMGKLPLHKAAELYFGWKSAKNSDDTIKREKRIFNAVLKTFGSGRTVRSIQLFHLRQYQQQRRHHVSHMKQPVTARTVNYELDLLRGVMKYTGCWTSALDAGYQACLKRKARWGNSPPNSNWRKSSRPPSSMNPGKLPCIAPPSRSAQVAEAGRCGRSNSEI
jgi:hypothetical protein